jgi:hypothetical protein
MAVSLFMFGWLVLWILLIIVGTFLRGPNWNFFGPFEWWDPHKVVALNNINLSEYIWVIGMNKALPANALIRESMGFVTVFVYLGLLPFILAKSLLKDMYEAYGPVRYSCLMFFGLAMLSLPIKMYLRWLFNLKYIIAIPEWFFNI